MSSYDNPRPTSQPVGSTDLVVAKDNLITLDRMVSGTSGTPVSNRKGEQLTPLVDIIDSANSKVNEAIGASFGVFIGNYPQTYTNYNQYTVFNGQQYGIKTPSQGGPALPYTPTEADPANDANLKIYGDASQPFVREAVTAGQEELIGGQIYPEIGNLENGMTVPSGTTHLRVGGQIYAMSTLAGGLVSNLTAISVTIGGAFVYLDPISSTPTSANVRDFASFADAVSFAERKSLKLVGNVDGFEIDTVIKTSIDMELSGTLKVTGSGSLELIKSEYQDLVATQSEFTQYSLDIPSLSDFTGLIYISTSDFWLNREDSSEVVYKGEVNFCDKGKLRLPLIFDYTLSSGFVVKGVISSSQRSVYKLPAFDCEDTTGDVVLVRGDNVEIDLSLEKNQNPAQFKNFLRFDGVSNFKVGLKTDVPFGSSSFTAYDCYMVNAISGVFDNPTCAQGSWKSIDGTNYRNVTVIGGAINAMHSHWGGSDVVVKGTIAKKPFLFAGADINSTYDIDAVVLDAEHLVGVRKDYGCMAGELKVKGKIRPLGSDVAIVKLVTDIQTLSGNTNTYLLPNTIDVDVRVFGGNSAPIKIVDTRNDLKYPSNQKLNMWKRLTAKIDYSEYAGVPVQRVGVMPYNNANHKYTLILREFVDNGRPMNLSIGKQNNSANDNVNCDLFANKIKVSNDEVESRAMIPTSGLLSFNECTLFNKMYSRGVDSAPSKAQLTINDSRWVFENSSGWTSTDLRSIFTTVSNVIFDGSQLSGVVNGGFWVNVTSNNVALNLGLSTQYAGFTEATGVYNPSLYTFAPINAVGQKNNFSIQPDGSYRPTW